MKAAAPLKGLPVKSSRSGGLVTPSACTSASTIARATRVFTGMRGERRGSSLARSWGRERPVTRTGGERTATAAASSRRVLPPLLPPCAVLEHMGTHTHTHSAIYLIRQAAQARPLN